MTALSYAASAALGAVILLGILGVSCLLAEGLWRLAGWLTERDHRDRPWG